MNIDERIHEIWPFYKEDRASMKLGDNFIEKALKSLQNNIGKQWMERFLKLRLQSGSIKPITLIDTREIFLLGSWLDVLNQRLSQKNFEIVVKKLESALSGAEKSSEQGFQLNDVFSELEVLAAFADSNHGSLEIEKETGVQGRSGERNAEFYLMDKDLFVEVKAYHWMEGNKHKKFIKESSALFSTEGNIGKSFSFKPTEQWKYTEHKYDTHGAAASVEINGTVIVHSLKKLLRSADRKFIHNQKAVVVLDRVHGHDVRNAVFAANEFFEDRPQSAIHSIVIKTARNWGLGNDAWKSKVSYVSRDSSLENFFSSIEWPTESCTVI